MNETANKKQQVIQNRLRDLHRLLTDLHRQHLELLEVVQKKLFMMRQSSVEGMQDCMQTEHQLVRKIQHLDGLRQQLVLQIGQDHNVEPDEVRMMSMSRLGHLVGGQDGIRLQATAQQLSGVMIEISKVNQVISSFAEQMLGHYRYIFNRLSEGARDESVYGHPAMAQPLFRAQVVDATA